MRHGISLDELISWRYDWIIKENGQSEFQRLHMSRFLSAEISLRIVYFKPLDEYLTDFEFPYSNGQERAGFVETFELDGEILLNSAGVAPLSKILDKINE